MHPRILIKGFRQCDDSVKNKLIKFCSSAYCFNLIGCAFTRKIKSAYNGAFNNVMRVDRNIMSNTMFYMVLNCLRKWNGTLCMVLEIGYLNRIILISMF